jgi:hypothetical protein
MAPRMADPGFDPYARPQSPDSMTPPSSAEDAQVSVKALRLAGMVLAFFSCMKASGLRSSVSAMLSRFGSLRDAVQSWDFVIAILPGVIGLAIPFVLAVALLRGKARYRHVAWLYADAVSALGLIGALAFQTMGHTALPRSYFGAVCAQTLLFALAVSLLLVGRPGPSRVGAGAILGGLYVLTGLGISFL